MSKEDVKHMRFERNLGRLVKSAIGMEARFASSIRERQPYANSCARAVLTKRFVAYDSRDNGLANMTVKEHLCRIMIWMSHA
jgi:hypothetical protein